MNINDLIIFQAVAEYGSFTKAAAVTNTVQSNVTARVKFLEEYFNTKLLKRTTRQVELTEDGLCVLKAAKELQLIIDNTRSSISKTPLSLKGIIKIGCVHTTADLRAPGILKNFVNKYPTVEFRLKTGTSTELIKEVLSYKLDGAFVSDNMGNTDLDIQHVFTEEFCIVSSSVNATLKQVFNKTKPIKLIVFNKGCAYRERLTSVLTDWNLVKLKFIEMDTLDGIINSVEAGVGITLLPLELIEKHYFYRNLKTFLLPEPFAKCPIQFVKRKDFPMSEGYTLFVKSIVDGYNDY